MLLRSIGISQALADAIGRIVGSGKLEKTRFRRNPVGARSLESLGARDRLGLEGLLLFMYHNFIL